MTNKERLEAFKRDGYTVFEGLFDEPLMASWRAAYPSIVDRQTPDDAAEPTRWLRSVLEFEPRLFLPAVANTALLEFAESVLGPFVQLDNLTFMAFPSMPTDSKPNQPTGWHRDMWAHYPQHEGYTLPLACNAITYLQDMTEAYGPLRVIPGSHRHPTAISGTQSNIPHPDEKVVHAKAGDVIFTHAALYHSGTNNCSGADRYFVSIYYNKSWLKPRDNHQGPAVQAILDAARRNRDRRLMRLLGEDPMLEMRANCGYHQEEEIMWQEWIEADRQAQANA